jgi:Rad9
MSRVPNNNNFNSIISLAKLFAFNDHYDAFFPVLGKAIQTLSRIGDELYVEPHADGIYFRTVNAQRSAFATFNFSRSFFLYYSVADDDNVAAGSSQPDLEPEKCKVPMKVRSLKSQK